MASEDPVTAPRQSSLRRRYPYIEAQAVVAVSIVLDVALPQKLTVGPFWLLPSFEAVLLVALVATGPSARGGDADRRRGLAIGLIGLVSLVNAISLALLVHYLLHGGKESGRSLILAGMVLWLTNVLLFGLWYWEIDRGGPVARARGEGPPDFLFPQMTTPEVAPRGWQPELVDYLYVSFTNATAFSPTDTMPLSRSAKGLMSCQALVALVTIGLVVARAVNILT